MLALPPAPAPAPRRQVFAGTAVAGAAATMLIGGQLAVWWRFREASPLREGSDGLVKAWLPEDRQHSGVPTNIMLVTMFRSVPDGAVRRLRRQAVPTPPTPHSGSGS